MEQAQSLTQSLNITVICPYRNEEKYLVGFGPIIEALVRVGVEVIFIDSQSTDNSRNIVNSWSFPKLNLTLNSPTPSVGKAVLEASKYSTRNFVLILPIDVYLFPSQILDLENYFEKDKKLQWGAFLKTFDKNEWYYRLYSWLQNTIRLKILKRVVWTNVIFAQKDLILKLLVEPQGFMEDTQLSDSLRKYNFAVPSKRPVIVSNRKFARNPLKQMAVNVFILLCYRLKIFSLDKLKEFYYDL